MIESLTGRDGVPDERTMARYSIVLCQNGVKIQIFPHQRVDLLQELGRNPG